jgi:hypothetical protein
MFAPLGARAQNEYFFPGRPVVRPGHPRSRYQRRTLPVWRNHHIFFEPSCNAYSTAEQLTSDPHLSGYISALLNAILFGRHFSVP